MESSVINIATTTIGGKLLTSPAKLYNSMKNNYSSRAFISSMVLLGLFGYLILAKFFTFINFSFFASLRIILISSIFIVFCIGSFLSLKGIKEPNTWKKIIGLIINFGLGGLCFIAMIISLTDGYGYGN